LLVLMTVASIGAISLKNTYYTWFPPQWAPFSKAEITAANNRGQIVLVSFTARWMPASATHGGVLGDGNIAFRRMVADHNLILQEADYTNPNAKIKAELRRLHCNTVPVIAIYSPGHPPIVLRDIVSGDQLRKAIQSAVLNLQTDAND